MTRLLDALRELEGVTWSAAVRRDGVVLDSLEPDLVLPTASIGKIFLLAAVAEQIDRGELDAGELLEPDADLSVADSGILQFFSGARQRVDDLALLVGAVSDNLATNVLLRRVGFDALGEITTRVGAERCALHDFVRDRRGPEHPRYLSTGAAGEWADLLERLAADRLISAPIDAMVRRWLAAGSDLSMVAAAFSLDPLAHVDADLGVRLVNKTGTNTGTRADLGIVSAEAGELSYAVIARWAPDSYAVRTAVLGAMRAVGVAIRGELVGH
jgi:beta-lactamase class A